MSENTMGEARTLSGFGDSVAVMAAGMMGGDRARRKSQTEARVGPLLAGPRERACFADTQNSAFAGLKTTEGK